MSVHVVTFENGHLGRSSQGPLQPFEVTGPDDSDLDVWQESVADQIYRVAQKRLTSGDVDIVISDTGGAVFVGGFRRVGTYTICPPFGDAR